MYLAHTYTYICMYLHYELLLMSIFTVYEEEPHRLAGAVEGGEVGGVVGVG